MEMVLTNPYDAAALIAAGYVGVKDGDPLVSQFQSCVPGSRPEGQPWCMDFVQFCVKRVEEGYPQWPAKILRSQSVLETWRASSLVQRGMIPKPGLIVIWEHLGSGNGHCGIVQKETLSGGLFQTVEGNTTPGTGLHRMGDGVYLKTRSMIAVNFKDQGQLKLLGFLDVF